MDCIKIYVSKADASLSSGLWRPPSIPSLHVYSNAPASINFLINARQHSSYHFHTPTISQYFPHIILLPFSYPHIILNINLISVPQRQHFSKSSSSTTHSQICIGPKGDKFLGDLRNIDIFNYKNYDLEIHIESFANSATFAWNHWFGILQHWRNVSVLPAPQVYTRCKM